MIYPNDRLSERYPTLFYQLCVKVRPGNFEKYSVLIDKCIKCGADPLLMDNNTRKNSLDVSVQNVCASLLRKFIEQGYSFDKIVNSNDAVANIISMEDIELFDRLLEDCKENISFWGSFSALFSSGY